MLRELYLDIHTPTSKTKTPAEETYTELKTSVNEDGEVEKRRQLSPGEHVLHGMFGAPPPRSTTESDD